MAIDRTARWLHLSDLHCPGRDDRAWEEAISSALDRLREVRERWGTIDFVLISGNVARAGRTDEYARATRLVEEVQQRLTRDKDSPVVLAVPGVHDVQGADGDARGVADTGGEQTFANWSAWWSSLMRVLPAHARVREGSVPGDFSATITLADRDLRIGVAGINTVTGQEDTDERAPARLQERLENLFGGASDEWRRHHDAAVLVTSTAPLSLNAPAHPWSALTSARFKIMHHGGARAAPDREAATPLEDGAIVQTLSFSGYDPQGAGDFHQIRLQGGAVAEIDFFHPTEAVLRVWEYNLRSRELKREPVLQSYFPKEAPLGGLPPGLVELDRRPTLSAEELAREPSRDEVEALLWAVLPDNTDFKEFTFFELRDAHQRIPQSLNRKARTRMLLDARPASEIAAALRRYLPETTDARLRELRAASKR
jgi:hypothetical protein